MKIKFNELEILEETKQALSELGFLIPTDVQESVIPKMILGDDIICQSKTGSGKTFAFSIPIIEKIDINSKDTQSLILTPTRELSIQVFKEVLKLVKFYPKLKVALIVGGESYERQFKELKKHPHIVVGTPGRVIDHLKRETVDFSKVEILTLDEADEMLKMGFLEDLEFILSTIPNTKQTVLFSATIPNQIKMIASKYLNNPITIKIDNTVTVKEISQRYYLVKEEDKLNLLKRVLDYYEPNSVIVFTNTKKRADEVAFYLQDNNYLADAIHGDLKQSERSYVMSRFRNKLLKILLATDVAARGLDINDVELVINFDLPEQNEVYVHRIGRTGRAGKKGIAYSFVTPRRKRRIEEIEKLTKAKITLEEIPTNELIYDTKLERFKSYLTTIMDKDKEYHLKKLSEFMTNEHIKNTLLNALINEIIPLKKEYQEIEIIKEKKQEPKKELKSNPNYTRVKINLGKDDKITPQVLFRLLQKEYDLHQRNIGNIKINKNETTFEVKKPLANKINFNKQTTYKNRKLTFKKV